MKRLLLCLLVLSVSVGSWAQLTSKDGKWKYTLSGNNATVAGATNKTGTNLEIPPTIDGHPVTAIADYAFYRYSGYTGSLTIPASVTSIGRGAFSNCTGLKGALTIPASVKSIGTAAFFECAGFDGPLTIPEGVTTIGERAFYGCSKLKGALTIPTTVTSIGSDAFNRCSSLDGVLTIKTTQIKRIEKSAFFGCNKLKGPLKIPASVERIGDYAFAQCYELNGSLTIPAKVKTIGKDAFSDCPKLIGTLTIPANVDTIGDNAFRSCPGFTSLTIANGVKTIGTYAFANNNGFTGALTIPASVTKIGTYAFASCTELTSLKVLATTATIEDYAFSSCWRLQSATFATTGNLTLGNDLFRFDRELRYIDASSLPASIFSNFDVLNKFFKSDYTLLYLPQGATISSDVPNVVIGSTCKDFRLYETKGFGMYNYGQYGYEYGTAIIKTFTATSAVYTGKNLTDNGVYTLYLPYNITLPTTIEAYTLSNYGSKTAVFKKHTGTLQAYTPYLIKRVGSTWQTLDNTTMPSVSVTKAPNYLTNTKGGSATDNATGTWKFLGTTNPISNADAEANRLYVLEANNTWRPVKSTVAGGHVRSLRAFLQAPVGYSGAPVAFMLDEGDTTTGLETIEAEVKKENVDIYTVEGRFVGRNYESLPSGLYIIGGKKVYKF